jgi:hypothetical protein
MAGTTAWRRLDYVSGNSSGHFKPFGIKNPQNSTNPCTSGGTTIKKLFILATTTSNQDEKKTKKLV